ncbi:MAG: hypothetical protein Q4E12_01825 [Coriobacteriia bacterium]|nr:hypothetical protein [Coriobacteriia bacterium]
MNTTAYYPLSNRNAWLAFGYSFTCEAERMAKADCGLNLLDAHLVMLAALHPHQHLSHYAYLLGVSKNTLTSCVKRLRRKKVLQRTVAANDKRCALLCLTEKGHTLAGELALACVRLSRSFPLPRATRVQTVPLSGTIPSVGVRMPGAHILSGAHLRASLNLPQQPGTYAQVAELMRFAHQVLLAQPAFEAIAKDIRLALLPFIVLKALGERPKELVRNVDIESTLGFSKPLVSKAKAGLNSNGYLVNFISENDRRSRFALLSPAGNKALACTQQRFDQIFDAFFPGYARIAPRKPMVK